ncbi:MAG: hypothetical protein MHPSP_002897, partial [Paramarteilia canceri]
KYLNDICQNVNLLSSEIIERIPAKINDLSQDICQSSNQARLSESFDKSIKQTEEQKQSIEICNSAFDQVKAKYSHIQKKFNHCLEAQHYLEGSFKLVTPEGLESLSRLFD